MKNLTLSFLPTKVRGVFYAAVVVLVLIVSAAQGGFENIGKPDPSWLGFASGAVEVLAIAVSTLALSNLTPSAKSEVSEGGSITVINTQPEIVVPKLHPADIEDADDPEELDAPESDEVDPGDLTNDVLPEEPAFEGESSEEYEGRLAH